MKAGSVFFVNDFFSLRLRKIFLLIYAFRKTVKRNLMNLTELDYGIDYEEIARTDAKGKEDTRIVMKFHPALAPFKAAVLPLAKKLSPVAEPIHEELSKYFMVDYDASGSIGKRYRRQDEIGTPFCVTFDFESLEDESVTIRFRDSMEQVRIKIDELENWFAERLAY